MVMSVDEFTAAYRQDPAAALARQESDSIAARGAPSAFDSQRTYTAGSAPVSESDFDAAAYARNKAINLFDTTSNYASVADAQKAYEDAIKAAGMTPYQHYTSAGFKEGINPTAGVLSQPKKPTTTTTTKPGTTGIPGSGGTSQANLTSAQVAALQGATFSNVALSASTPGATSATQPGYDATRVATDIGSIAGVKQPTSYFDQAKSTVAGQLSTLLASDNPYIQLNEQRAKEQSASRGMLNSTLAAQAGREAAIGAALPIAQQDASEYNKFALQTQATQNQQSIVQTEAIASSELAKQNAAIAQTKQNIQNEFTARLQGASEQSKAWLQDMQNQYASGEAALDREQQLLLQREQISAEKTSMIRSQASQIMQNYQISVENLLTDPDFLNLGPEALQNSISQLQTLASNSIKFLGASSGVDMAPFVDAFLNPITITK